MSSMAQEFSWNQQHLIRNGKPWLPTMGEFHYSRYPREEWRGEIRKMKACGVEIIATYVFWIHHEAKEGVFDFTGQRDVGEFLRICGEEGLYVWLRIGPWCHGECRHGGFPEWLMKKEHPIRCNDPKYLALVRSLWLALYRQTHAALYKEGGPVIGIQIENEFGHCGGEGGDVHINALYDLAREIGFEVPYYTATGWGGAYIGKLLPVMGCYCDAPWDRRLEPLPPSPNYIFSHERNDVDVGSDFRRGEHVTFDEDAYPFLLAEMGGGINSTFHRRPTATPADAGAMALTKLGSGANLIGYYMYHAGTNPGPELNETRESGSWCETPALNYLPRSPIGEYGQITPLAKETKLLAMFTRDYGEMLAPMPAVIPEDSASRPADTEHLRYAWRKMGESGFLFINNHQRGMELPAHSVDVPGFGNVEIGSGEYAIYPVGLKIGNAVLRSAHATPLCILNGNTWVFYTDHDDAYEIEGDLGEHQIITLTRQEALNAWRVIRDGHETLILCEAPVIQSKEGIAIHSRKDVQWRDVLSGESGTITVPRVAAEIHYTRSNVNYMCYEYELTLEYTEADETFLRVEYEGALAELYVNGNKVADDNYDGRPWEIGLRRFGNPKKAALRIYALFVGMPVWLQEPPVYVDGRALKLHSVSIEHEYHLAIK